MCFNFKEQNHSSSLLASRRLFRGKPGSGLNASENIRPYLEENVERRE